ncbi:MAG: hypothetical protein A2Y66_08825 [Nitrospirae bacterium RBG_13_41_22]|nr:MAG: hypothetical protein A2Y66_08825 [Nitrospirae bacterium RBG_13_41_22]
MNREKISATIITYNEEENIRDCLQSIKWADEIIVVDSGSSDRTVEICSEYTDKLFLNTWLGMKEQKQFAVSNASNLWIFSIDADERPTEKLKEYILEELKNPTSDGYRFPRKNYFLGKWLKHGGWYPDYVLRFFRRDKGYFGGINPHDKVIIETKKIGTISAPILHYPYKSLTKYVIKQNLYSSISATEKFNSMKKKKISPFIILIKTASKFTETYFIKRGFMDGFYGLIVGIGTAYSTFLKYAKLWELTRSKKGARY